jgi:hypothetical protein
MSFARTDETELDPEASEFRPAYDRGQADVGGSRQTSDDRELGAERRTGFRADEGAAHTDVYQHAGERAPLTEFARNGEVYGYSRVAAFIGHGYPS